NPATKGVGKRDVLGGADPNNVPRAIADDSKRPQRVVAELGMAKVTRAIYSERQLQQVMDDFWFNHFNVFAGKGEDRYYITSYERDVIQRSEEHTSELQSRRELVCRLLLEKKKTWHRTFALRE